MNSANHPYEFKRRTYTDADKHLNDMFETIRDDNNDNLCCIGCHSKITALSFLNSINGNTEHRFTNPAAITFHVACYSEAFNLRSQGKITPQDSWFPGHSWQIMLCANCSFHLGWEFSGPQHFFALILERLAQCNGD